MSRSRFAVLIHPEPAEAAGGGTGDDDAVGRAAIETDGFRFGKLLDLRHPDFTPGGAVYGDIPGLIALAAPGATWVLGEKEAPTLAATAFGPEASARLRVSGATADAATQEAAAFVGGN